MKCAPPATRKEYELNHFAGTTCEPGLRSRCPVLDRRAGAYDLVKVNIERRRRAEATEEWWT